MSKRKPDHGKEDLPTSRIRRSFRRSCNYLTSRIERLVYKHKSPAPFNQQRYGLGRSHPPNLQVLSIDDAPPKQKHTPPKQKHAPPKQKHTPPTLLSLPGELRNRIYEFVLVEPGMIEVIPRLKQPGLLRTCRKIRQETILIFYLNNKFEVRIHDLDTSLLVAFNWHLHWMRYKTPGLRNVRQLITTLNGRAHWGNLMRWAYLLWIQRGEWSILPDVDNDPFLVVVSAVTRAVRASAGVPWEKCEKILQAMRPVFGHLDVEWLKD